MPTLRERFEKQQAGFTVYSPDCARSRLWGNLDHAIHQATGFLPVYRHWIRHDFNSVMRFYRASGEEPAVEEDPQEAAQRYANIPAEELHYGHLVMKLFLSGPALLTMWQGENVVPTLLALKGQTHPAEAAPNTIRGRFWCDNAVANLLHTSDDDAEAARELRAINLGYLLDAELIPRPLLDALPPPAGYVAHSGISVVGDLARRLCIGLGLEAPSGVELPPSGDAKETEQVLAGSLRETARRLSGSEVAALINAYLTGDVVTVSHMMEAMPLTEWEYFIIQCGAITRDKWNAG